MPFSGIVEPEQLAILTTLVVWNRPLIRQGWGGRCPLVMTLFSVGASTAEELGVALRARPRRAKKHYCSGPTHFLI